METASSSGGLKPAERQRVDAAARWLDSNLAAQGDPSRASRILIAGDATLPQPWAVAIARLLAEDGDPVLLIDTSQGGLALSAALELPRSPGLAELCQRRAEFEDVIWRDPPSGCHFLPSGRPRAVGGGWGEPGAADRVLRALDASYRTLIICAEAEEAHLLAGNLKRRFSAAILIEARPPGLGRGIRDLFAVFGFPALQVEPLR
ncbi:MULTISPECIES: hypothetical protein [Rhodomicrobium]|uniref:MinD/ParA family ATP-binding protein n=1 Tax=Rhodomicrobium TaxID=1068 RepID=UPI000B4BB658|nr:MULTISPECIES: hypothetical protein [Rhodomicrobium]